MRKLLFIALAVLAVSSFSCKQKLLGGRVTYYVDGTSTTYNVVYKNADGELVEVADAPYDWSLSFDARRGDELYLSATAQEPNSWVKVWIYVDGKELYKAAEKGDMLTATAKGPLKVLF